MADHSELHALCGNQNPSIAAAATRSGGTLALGDVCDRLHIGINCKAYQLNASIDAAENQKFGLQVATDQPMGNGQRWIELKIPGAQTGFALFTPDGHENRIGTFQNMSVFGTHYSWGQPGCFRFRLAKQ